MVKDKKITMTEEQVLSESIRIRDRDFREMRRDFYSSSDHTRRWSEQEIKQRVEDTVSRAKGIDVSAYQDTIDWHHCAPQLPRHAGEFQGQIRRPAHISEARLL
jgi:hypothetical protein